MLDLILLIGAAICFGAEAAGVALARVNLLALGLLLWVLTAIV